MLIYEETWQAQLDYLHALFEAAMVPGGKLDAIRTLARIVPPEGTFSPTDYPMLAFAYDGTDESWQSTRGTRQQNSFTLVLYVAEPFDATSPISDPVRQTELALQNLWNDRAGNGLGPTLREDPTLGQQAIYAIPSRVRIVAGRAAEESAGASGLLTCTFIAVAELQLE